MTSCAACTHWDPCLPGLGECLQAVKARQAAFVRSDDPTAFAREHPPVCARDTEATDACPLHEAVA